MSGCIQSFGNGALSKQQSVRSILGEREDVYADEIPAKSPSDETSSQHSLGLNHDGAKKMF